MHTHTHTHIHIHTYSNPVVKKQKNIHIQSVVSTHIHAHMHTYIHTYIFRSNRSYVNKKQQIMKLN
jgi:hypothetical protein